MRSNLFTWLVLKISTPDTLCHQQLTLMAFHATGLRDTTRDLKHSLSFLRHYFRVVILLLHLATSSPYLCEAQVQEDSSVSSLSEFSQRVYKRQLSNKRFFERTLLFTDPSWGSPPYFDLGSEKDSYILSADIQPVFAIGGEKFPIAIHLVPRYKVRIFKDNPKFRDTSLAVRTPSFMPGGYVLIPITRISDPYDDLHYLSLRYSHHSNGQDGNPVEADGSYNTYNGDFSTDFIELGYNFNFRNRRTKALRKDFCPVTNAETIKDSQMKFPFCDWFGRFGIEQHVFSQDALKGRYGKTRINLKVGYLHVTNHRWRVRSKEHIDGETIGSCYKRELFRVIVNVNINVDKLDEPYSDVSRRVNADISGYMRLLAGNTAAFLSIGYYGNDPYNVYFEKNYFFIRGGVALGFFVNTNKLNSDR